MKGACPLMGGVALIMGDNSRRLRGGVCNGVIQLQCRSQCTFGRYPIMEGLLYRMCPLLADVT